MDGLRIQQYMSNEAKALLTVYRQFQTLLPHDKHDCSVHNGEDGRYVESLIKEFLRRFLPRELEVCTGFILRPAVKTGRENRSRDCDQDQNSSQLDILIYDSHHCPVFQRFGDNVIVPPEGVVGIISVKKKFNAGDFAAEANALKEASKLCRLETENEVKIRGPFLAMIAMNSIEKVKTPTHEWIFDKVSSVYDKENDCFDDAVGLITNVDGWSIFKKRPFPDNANAQYVYYEHQEDEDHLGLQLLLTGILSVYYDTTRSRIERPGFTAFTPNRTPEHKFDLIEFDKLR